MMRIHFRRLLKVDPGDCSLFRFESFCVGVIVIITTNELGYIL